MTEVAPESPRPALPAAPLRLEVAPARRTVLVVEDDPVVRRALCRTLAREGFGVVAAATVAAVVAVAEPIDAAVLDLDLPDGDGLTLGAKLRDTRPAAPLVFFTARDDAASAARASTLGDHVSKRRGVPAVLALLHRAADGLSGGSAGRSPAGR